MSLRSRSLSILGSLLAAALSGCFSASSDRPALSASNTSAPPARPAPRPRPPEGPTVPEEWNQLSQVLATGDRAYSEFLRMYWEERREVMTAVKNPFRMMGLHLQEHKTEDGHWRPEFSACQSPGKRHTSRIQKSRVRLQPGLRPGQVGSLQYLATSDCSTDLHLAATFEFHPFVRGESKLEIRMQFFRSWLSEDFGQFLASKSDPATCTAVLNSHQKLESLTCQKLGQDLPSTRRKSGSYFELSEFRLVRTPSFELQVRGSNFNEAFSPTCDFGREKGPGTPCFEFACRDSDPAKQCHLEENLITAEARATYEKALRDLGQPTPHLPPPPRNQALGPEAPVPETPQAPAAPGQKKAAEKAMAAKDPRNRSQDEWVDSHQEKPASTEVDPAQAEKGKDVRPGDPKAVAQNKDPKALKGPPAVTDPRNRSQEEYENRQRMEERAWAQAETDRRAAQGTAEPQDVNDPARQGLDPATAAAQDQPFQEQDSQDGAREPGVEVAEAVGPAAQSETAVPPPVPVSHGPSSVPPEAAR